jgi:hypothetical protein
VEDRHHRPHRLLSAAPATRRHGQAIDVSAKVRQIAIKNIGRDEPTLLITHDLATLARDQFARYAERIMVENDRPDLLGRKFFPDEIVAAAWLKDSQPPGPGTGPGRGAAGRCGFATGAPGVSCSPVPKPSHSHRYMVALETPSWRAASVMLTMAASLRPPPDITIYTPARRPQARQDPPRPQHSSPTSPARRELITAIITSQPPREWSGHELAILLHVKFRNMLTQLGEWTCLGAGSVTVGAVRVSPGLRAELASAAGLIVWSPRLCIGVSARIAASRLVGFVPLTHS